MAPTACIFIELRPGGGGRGGIQIAVGNCLAFDGRKA
jgi:hypothetical protein